MWLWMWIWMSDGKGTESCCVMVVLRALCVPCNEKGMVKSWMSKCSWIVSCLGIHSFSPFCVLEMNCWDPHRWKHREVYPFSWGLLMSLLFYLLPCPHTKIKPGTWDLSAFLKFDLEMATATNTLEVRISKMWLANFMGTTYIVFKISEFSHKTYTGKM